MTGKQYYYCVSETQNYNDVEAYMSDIALSSVWGEGSVPEGRLAFLYDLFLASKRPIRQIASDSGRSVRDLGLACGISYNTIQKWTSDDRTPPPYIPIMIIARQLNAVGGWGRHDIMSDELADRMGVDASDADMSEIDGIIDRISDKVGVNITY